MEKRSFRRLFGYTSTVPSTMPQLAPGQDMRDLGRYSIPEAASLIAMPERTMRSWFLGKKRIFRPSFHHGDTVRLSFNDVTEAYIVESLRNHWDFGPHSIRRILKELRRRTKLERPLIRRSLAVLPQFKSVVAMVPSKGKTIYPDVAHDQNLVFDEFVQAMGMRIRRDSQGRPVRIYPSKDAESEDLPVSMDPTLCRAILLLPVLGFQRLLSMQRNWRVRLPIRLQTHIISTVT